MGLSHPNSNFKCILSYPQRGCKKAKNGKGGEQSPQRVLLSASFFMNLTRIEEQGLKLRFPYGFFHFKSFFSLLWNIFPSTHLRKKKMS